MQRPWRRRFQRIRHRRPGRRSAWSSTRRGWREAFARTLTLDDVTAIARKLIEQAREGDKTASRLVLKYGLGGLPSLAIKSAEKDTTRAVFKAAPPTSDVMATIRNRMAEQESLEAEIRGPGRPGAAPRPPQAGPGRSGRDAAGVRGTVHRDFFLGALPTVAQVRMRGVGGGSRGRDGTFGLLGDRPGRVARSGGVRGGEEDQFGPGFQVKTRILNGGGAIFRSGFGRKNCQDVVEGTPGIGRGIPTSRS